MWDEGLKDLYQELILDHNARPRNFGSNGQPTHKAHGLNPLCGDDIEVFLIVEDGRISEAKFSGQGCAISKASASLMTEAITGLSTIETQKLFDIFHRLILGEEVSQQEMERLGKVAAFSGVAEYPARVKCASLAWHTLNAAINNTQEEISTE